MLKGATIVFDLDGTLVDTAPDLTNAMNDGLTRRSHPPVSVEIARSCVGHGAQVMIEQALRRADAEEDVDAMLAEFLVHYEDNIAAESRPYPGAEEALAWLKGQGARLAVCTNKRERLSRRLLEALELDSYFSAVAGRDTFPVSKPDPAHLLAPSSLPAAARPGPSWSETAPSIARPRRLPACRSCWSVSAMDRPRPRTWFRSASSTVSPSSKAMFWRLCGRGRRATTRHDA